MKYILLTIILSFSIIGFSQNKYNIADVNIINFSQYSIEDWMCFLKKNSSKVTGIVFNLNDSGNLILENSYKDGIVDGSVKQWFDNGQLQLLSNYKNGNLIGLSQSWYENGQLKTEQNYIDGKVDGEFISYYKNGQVQASGKRVNFLLEGTLLNYYESGQKKCEINYLNGQVISSKYWNENGKIVE